jgi:hypothetical protein
MRARKNAKNIYNNISGLKDRQILDVIRGLKKSASASMITSKYKELYDNEIDIEKLEQKLSEAEEAGLIQRKLTKINDNPYLGWETTF